MSLQVCKTICGPADRCFTTEIRSSLQNMLKCLQTASKKRRFSAESASLQVRTPKGAAYFCGPEGRSHLQPGKRDEAMSNRKAISKRVRFAVFERDRYTCRYCGAGGDGVKLHIDHHLAVANGGTNEIDNLLTACEPCNLGKGAMVVAALPKGGSDTIVCPFADGWPYDIEDPVFYMNDHWAVTGYGLECLSSFYPIEAKRLGEVRTGSNLSDWLLHVAEKEWIAEHYGAFGEAFARALQHHRVKYTFDLRASLVEGGRDAADTVKAAF